MLSQTDIQSADLSFDPPLENKCATRRVVLIAKQGAMLKGITITRKKGESYPRIDIPSVLVITNRPEQGMVEEELILRLEKVEQVVSELTRETLLLRIRERLAQGKALWPEYSHLKRWR